MMREQRYPAATEGALEGIARDILQRHRAARIFLFFGELGAGKTTLIKHFCRLLGVEDTVQSPTFSIVNEYRCCGDDLVYHMDLYRMEHVREIQDIGLEEYLFSGRYCFIEWPEKMGYIPEDAVVIRIHVLSGNRREIAVTPAGETGV